MKGFNVLILEDDVVTSVTLAKGLQAELPDAHVLRAGTLFEARLLLTSFDIQFFVLDINLPDGNGIDYVLDVTARNPKAGVAIITGTPLPKHRDRATSFGALYFFEKPLPARTLGEIIRGHLAATYGSASGSDTSFTASLTRLSVMDVIQLKCLTRATLRLDFRLKDGRFGSVYFNEGNITHAEIAANATAAPLRGMEALSSLLTWRGGKIEEIKGGDQPIPSIRGEWQALLLEAAHLADEAAS